MIDVYTRVLESAAAVADDVQADAIVSKLIQHLVSSGRMKLLPEIHSELKKVAAHRAALMPVVEVSHEKESAAALKAAAAAGIEAKKAHVNHSLVKGWRAKGHGQLIDRSAKAALIDIYQKVIA